MAGSQSRREGRGLHGPGNLAKELTQKWKVSVGTGDSSPALVGDKLYVFARVGGDEVISCLEADSGKKVWEQKYEAVDADGPSARHGKGPRSTPVVADGKVVTLGVSGVVSCLDAASGKVLWQNKDFSGDVEVRKVPQFYTSMSPLVTDWAWRSSSLAAITTGPSSPSTRPPAARSGSGPVTVGRRLAP